MSWSVIYDSELDIIQCIYAGRVTANDFKEGTIKTISLAKKHKTNLLHIDDSKLESAVSTMEIYEMPRFYDEVNGSRRSRLAITLPPTGQIREDVKFYETVCRNCGWTVKTFNKRQKAIDWLRRHITTNNPDGGDD